MERIGFIGLGLMGVPMVRRLRAAGFPVTVWNRSPGKTGLLADAGVTVAATPAALARAVDVLVLCVADTAAVEAVVFGDGADTRAEDCVAAGGSADMLLVDCSSIAPAATREFAVRLATHCGTRWVDAPVSGGVQGAASGTLAIMAGGALADVERARAVLAPLARAVTHMGPVGSGQVTKVCNQMIVGVNALVIAEVVALAEKCGVDATKIPQALAGGFADSLPLQILGPQMAARTFEPVKWRVRTLLKDLDNARALAAEVGGAVYVSEKGAELMRAHGAKGNLERDPATLVELYLGPGATAGAAAGEVSP